MKTRTLFTLAVVALVLAFAGAAVVYHSEPADTVDPALLVRSHSITLGNPQAKVHLVEFLDPACETCAAFYPFVKKLMAEHPDRIRLTIRYAPFHPGSDLVVKALEAARKQDKYWPALEALLASQAEWAPNHTAQIQLAWKPLQRAGVDLHRALFDMQAPDIDALLAQDVADTRALNVTKTPEFFVNGRPLPSFGYDQLRTAVRDAVKKAYP